jgi:hypothetical protein
MAITNLTCPDCSSNLYNQKIDEYKLDNECLNIIIKETNLFQCSSCSKVIVPTKVTESLLSTIALLLFEVDKISIYEDSFLQHFSVIQMKEGLSHPYCWSITRRKGKITAEVLYEA